MKIFSAYFTLNDGKCFIKFALYEELRVHDGNCFAAAPMVDLKKQIELWRRCKAAFNDF